MDSMCGVFNLQRFASLHGIDCCLVMVKQSNNFPIKQAYLRSISQTNNVKSVSQTVNTDRPHCLDCLTVDRPGLLADQQSCGRPKGMGHSAAGANGGCKGKCFGEQGLLGRADTDVVSAPRSGEYFVLVP
jgi:hypothetical protein